MSQPTPQPTALVVEDDYDASVIFAKALEVNGFVTEIIDRGDVALARLQELTPTIIVLDLHLPEVTGSDILRWMRSKERFNETRVIIASADPRNAEAVQEHADLVLIKPTTFSQVRDFAERLTKRKARRTAEKTGQLSPTGKLESVSTQDDDTPTSGD